MEEIVPPKIEKYLYMIYKNHEKNYWRTSISTGRYYAMDRDNRWERTKDAFNLLSACKTKYKAKSLMKQ